MEYMYHTPTTIYEDFYNMIDSFIDLIDCYDRGKYCQSMGGNQYGTEIRVEFIEED